jgi:integrase
VLCTGNLEIMGKIAKSKATRTIEMQPNLREWLAPYAGSTGKIWSLSDNVFNHRCVPVRKAAGIQEWPHNCLRHSFASFHYAKFKNMGDLMNDLGHTSPEMIIKHYKRVQLKELGEKYFNIRPPTPASNIVQISEAA